MLPGIFGNVSVRYGPEDSAKRYSTRVEEAVTDEVGVRGCSNVIDTACPRRCSGKEECGEGMSCGDLLELAVDRI